jgi:hypothetical protein
VSTPRSLIVTTFRSRFPCLLFPPLSQPVVCRLCISPADKKNSLYIFHGKKKSIYPCRYKLNAKACPSPTNVSSSSSVVLPSQVPNFLPHPPLSVSALITTSALLLPPRPLEKWLVTLSLPARDRPRFAVPCSRHSPLVLFYLTLAIARHTEVGEFYNQGRKSRPKPNYGDPNLAVVCQRHHLLRVCVCHGSQPLRSACQARSAAKQARKTAPREK